MSVKIETIDKEHFEVNGKLIYQDADGKWMATQELTTQEAQEFNRHLNSINRDSQTKD